MIELQNSVKNLKLKEILLASNIDEEELLFEGEGDIICVQNGIDESQKGTLFASTERIGYISENGDSYLYNSIMRLREVLIDDDTNIIELVLAQKDNEDDKSKDYHISFSESESCGVFFEKTMEIHSFRFNNPMQCVIPLINEAITNILDGKFEKAISILDKANELDPETGVMDLIKARALNSMGKSKLGAITLARKFIKYCVFNPDCIIGELTNYEWTQASLRYLPRYDDSSDLQMFLIKAIKAKSENNYSEYVLNIYNATNDIVSIAISVITPLIVEHSSKNTAETFKKICKRISKLLEEADCSKLLEETERSKVDYYGHFMIVLENLKLYLNNPERAIRKIMNVTGEISDDNNEKLQSLLINEKYDEISSFNFKPMKFKFPENYTLYEIENMQFDDNYVDNCRFSCYRLYAVVRIGKVDSKKLGLLLRHVSEKISEHKERYFNYNNSLEMMLYYISSIEIFLKNGVIGEAIENINECRKNLNEVYGNYGYPILQYGRELMNFYEAWALGSFAEMEYCVKDIPCEDISWIHDLCLSIVEDLRGQVDNISSVNEADSHLNNLLNRFTEISQFTDITPQTRNQINEYLNGIKLRLNEKELRIAVVGETSTGKTTFLNTLFNTNLFFTTQEEATGVPTEIRKGSKIVVEVLDGKGKIRSALNSDHGSWFDRSSSPIDEDKKDNMWSVFRKIRNVFGTKKNNEDLKNCSPEEFIAKHTKIGENNLNWVDKVRVAMPIEDLPQNTVIIDTPGFNASYERAEIAKGVIADAHVCIFIIDARNALKNKEMEKLQMVRQEAGKTFFVLNKMDLVFSDDDLDCDGEDSVKMTLERVELELKKYFNLKDVMLYPICCIPREQVIRDALKYCDNISILKEDIFKESVIKKVELVVDMAVKEAVSLSNNVVKIGEDLISKHTDNKNRLLESMPIDPELFKSEIQERILGYYYTGKNRYIDIIVEKINSELRISAEAFYDWIVGVSSKNILKRETQARAEVSINRAIEAIEIARNRELDKLSNSVINQIENIFSELYSNLPFKASFKSKKSLDSMSTLNLYIGEELKGAISDIGDNISQEATAAAIGATVGLLLGPLGAVAGGFLGSLLFGKSIGEMKKEVLQAYCESTDSIYNKIIEVYERDTNNEYTQSYVNKLIAVIDSEIERYNTEITLRINQHNDNMIKVNKDIIGLKLKAYGIMDEVQILQKWRDKRYLN